MKNLEFKAFKFICEEGRVDKFVTKAWVYYNKESEEFKSVIYSNEFDTISEIMDTVRGIEKEGFKEVASYEYEDDILTIREVIDGGMTLQEGYDELL